MGKPLSVLMVVQFIWAVAGAQDRTAKLTGTITDAGTGDAVSGAQLAVSSRGGPRVAVTDDEGRFVLASLTAGTVVVRVRRLGYRSLEFEIDLGAGETFEAPPDALRLEPVPTRLRGLEVEGRGGELRRLNTFGFYDRRDAGFGTFVERDQIEVWAPTTVYDLMRYIPSVRVIPNDKRGRRLPNGRYDSRDYRVEMTGANIGNRAECPPLLFLDGVPLGSLVDVDLADAIVPADIQGVEVYRGSADVPAQFGRRGSECGVLVFWTRQG